MWRLRVWIVGAGFAVAPVVAALVLAGWNAVSENYSEEAAWYSFNMDLLFAALATVLVAIPLYLLARHARAVNLGTILGGGVVTSLIPLMLIAQGADGPVLLVSLVAGALGALAFWAIWRCGRRPSTLMSPLPERGETSVPRAAGDDPL